MLWATTDVRERLKFCVPTNREEDLTLEHSHFSVVQKLFLFFRSCTGGVQHCAALKSVHLNITLSLKSLETGAVFRIYNKNIFFVTLLVLKLIHQTRHELIL